MSDKQEKFLNGLKVDLRKEHERMQKRERIFKMIDEKPELLNSLSFEKLKIIERLYAEDYRRLKKY